jgi:hypothetical protein
MIGDMADGVGNSIDTKQNKLVYRRRIWNENPGVEHDEGPYRAIDMSGQSYKILEYKGAPRINPYLQDGIDGSQFQQTIAPDESYSGSPRADQSK